MASALARQFLQLLKSALDPAGRPPGSRPTSFVWNHAGHEFILSEVPIAVRAWRHFPHDAHAPICSCLESARSLKSNVGTHFCGRLER